MGGERARRRGEIPLLASGKRRRRGIGKLKVLVVKNIGIEGPGSLGSFLREAGCEIEQVDLQAGDQMPRDAQNYGLAVILGGPMNCYEEEKYPFLRDELSFIDKCVKENVKVLGLCLGAQLIARALGASVEKNSKKEIGWYDLQLTDHGKNSPLFSGLPDSFKAFHWHGDRFDIPAGGVRLAQSALCENQAFIYENRALAFQFHLEIDGRDIGNWCVEYREELQRENGENALEQMLEATKKEMPALTSIAGKFYENFYRWIR